MVKQCITTKVNYNRAINFRKASETKICNWIKVNGMTLYFMCQDAYYEGFEEGYKEGYEEYRIEGRDKFLKQELTYKKYCTVMSDEEIMEKFNIDKDTLDKIKLVLSPINASSMAI